MPGMCSHSGRHAECDPHLSKPLLWQVLDEQLARRGDAAAPLRPALLRMVADVQHRLIFRAQAFIKVQQHVVHACAGSMHIHDELMLTVCTRPGKDVWNVMTALAYAGDSGRVPPLCG